MHANEDSRKKTELPLVGQLVQELGIYFRTMQSFKVMDGKGAARLLLLF